MWGTQGRNLKHKVYSQKQREKAWTFVFLLISTSLLDSNTVQGLAHEMVPPKFMVGIPTTISNQYSPPQTKQSDLDNFSTESLFQVRLG